MKKMILASILLSVGLMAAGSGQMKQNRVMKQNRASAQNQYQNTTGTDGEQFRYRNQNRYRNGSGPPLKKIRCVCGTAPEPDR